MGKVLIIKGADFSENGIERVVSLPLYQGYVKARPQTSNTGIIDLETAMTANILLTQVLIRKNSSILVSIKDGNNIIDDLNITYVASTENIAVSHGNTVTNIVDNLYPWDNSMRQSDGSFLVSNNTNNDMYYYINFAYSNDGPEILVNGKTCSCFYLA